MASTNKTPHYSLPQFIGSDKPSWLGDVNDAMSKIDTAIFGAATVASEASEGIGTATENATKALEAASEAKATASQASLDASAAQTSATNAVAQATTAQTAATAAQTSANNAATSASQASESASAAVTTANNALTAANEAKESSNNLDYLKIVRNKTPISTERIIACKGATPSQIAIDCGFCTLSLMKETNGSIYLYCAGMAIAYPYPEYTGIRIKIPEFLREKYNFSFITQNAITQCTFFPFSGSTTPISGRWQLISNTDLLYVAPNDYTSWGILLLDGDDLIIECTPK